MSFSLWIRYLCQNDYSSFCLLFLPTHLSQLCISDKNGGGEHVRHTHMEKSTTWNINRDDEQWCKTTHNKQTLKRHWKQQLYDNITEQRRRNDWSVMRKSKKRCDVWKMGEVLRLTMIQRAHTFEKALGKSRKGVGGTDLQYENTNKQQCCSSLTKTIEILNWNKS